MKICPTSPLPSAQGPTQGESAASTSPRTRTARPLHCGSARLEKLYQDFCAEIALEDRPSVCVLRTAGFVYVDVAGQWRIGKSLKTGCIHQWEAHRDPAGRVQWIRVAQARAFALQMFGASSTAAGVVQRAWQRRWERYAEARSAQFRQLQDRMARSQFDPSTPRTARARYAALFVGARKLGSRERTRVIAKALYSAVWGHLVDKDVVRLALRFFPVSQMSFQAYNLVVRERSHFAARLAESGALCSLLGARLWVEAPGKSAQISTSAFKTFIANPEAAKRLQESLRECGLSRAGWKLVCATSWTMLQRLEMYARPMESFEDVFNCLAQAGVQDAPDSALLKVADALIYLKRCARSRADRVIGAPQDSAVQPAHLRARRVFVRALAAYLEEAKRRKARKTLKAFLRSEPALVWDWLASLLREIPEDQADDPVQPGVTWSALMRRQRAWHQQAAQREAERRKQSRRAAVMHRRRERQLRWESLVPSHSRKFRKMVFEVTALTTGSQLEREGRGMRHCVADYITLCAKGQSRIFHARLLAADAQQEATVEIVWDGARWRVRQVHAAANQPVSEIMHRLSKDLARQYQAETSSRSRSKG